MLVLTFADHMRLIIFYTYLGFLLFGGGNYLYAETHQSPTGFSFNHNLEKKQQIKNRNTNQRSLLIECDDNDLDEEFHISDERNDGTMNKFLAGKQSLLTSWYLSFSSPKVYKDYSKKIKIFSPFCGQSNPIYITLNVLRV